MPATYSANRQQFRYKPGQQQKHCIFLHGWDMKQNISFVEPGIPPILQLKPFVNYLSATLRRHGWTHHRIVYPSQLPFPQAAREVSKYLSKIAKKHHLDFSNTVLIGYSTGGLVARSLVADFKFPCTALLTLATPHSGLLSYAEVFKFLPSVAAMVKGSQELWRINNNRNDIRMRRRYYFYGITFTGHLKENHPDDGLVSLESATGQMLTGISPRNRVKIHIPKRSSSFGSLVHNQEALQPQHVRPFLNTCTSILQKY